jgi:hypothetical protein
MSAITSTPTDAEAKNATKSGGLFSWTSAPAGYCPQTLTLRFEDHHQRRPEVAR